jgi:hypothetical protein
VTIRGLVGMVVALAIGAVAVLALREATLSTHQDTPPGSTSEYVVHTRVNRGEGNSLLSQTEAIVALCQLEVGAAQSGPVTALGDDRFGFVLQPSLDDTDEVQFAGCVEDWKIDSLLVDIEHRETHGGDD